MIQQSQPDQILVGLDAGTTNICTVVGEVVNGILEFRGMHLHPSSGMRKGIIVSIEDMVCSLSHALKETESICGIDINSVYVSISGAHMKSTHNAGVVAIGGRDIVDADVDRVLEAAKAMHVPLEREILHVIPAGYAIDGQNGIRNPRGMRGERLEVKVCTVSGLASSIQNLLRCCDRAGVEVAEVIFSPVAAAEAVLTEDEREMGVALIDIGGGTTDIILYRDGCPVHASVLPVGGNHFTNDIAVGLRIPVPEAERIKCHFGTADIDRGDKAAPIEVTQGAEKRIILQRNLAQIVGARTEEFLDLVRTELLSCSCYDIASTGLVLTGGGALLTGLGERAKVALGIPVRIGSPLNSISVREMANNPGYSTGAGLVLHGFEALSDKPSSLEDVTGIFGKMKDWAREIFKIKKGGIEYVRN